MAYCDGDVPGFVGVEGFGRALSDGAKAAVTRANVATQHEGGRAIGPALEYVRASRFLTNRMQFQPLDQLQQMVLVGRIAQTDP